MKIISLFGILIIAEKYHNSKFLSFEKNGETYLQFSVIDGDYGISIYRTVTSQFEIGYNKNGFYAQVAC